MATSTGDASTRQNTAKTMMADQISQAVESISNLFHFIQQSSSSEAQLMKLPKNLLAKTPAIKNTGQLLEKMPQVVSSMDAHLENGLQSVPHLQTVAQVLSNMKSCQLRSLFLASDRQQEHELAGQTPKTE